MKTFRKESFNKQYIELLTEYEMQLNAQELTNIEQTDRKILVYLFLGGSLILDSTQFDGIREIVKFLNTQQLFFASIGAIAFLTSLVYTIYSDNFRECPKVSINTPLAKKQNLEKLLDSNKFVK